MAVDDVQVTQVKVSILDDTGAVLEEGEAVQDGDSWWSYVTTAAAGSGARVLVTARDLPGNVVEMAWT